MLLNIDHINKPDLPELLLIIIFLLSSGNCLPNIGDGLRKTRRKSTENKNKYRAEAKRATGTSNQAIPRTYDEIVTRATKIRYVGTSSVAIVRC